MSMGSPKSDILDAIKRERRGRRWSQATLARLAGIGLPHMSNLENKKADPRLTTLLDVARALDLELMLVPKILVPAVRALISAKAADGSSPESGYLFTSSEED